MPRPVKWPSPVLLMKAPHASAEGRRDSVATRPPKAACSCSYIQAIGGSKCSPRCFRPCSRGVALGRSLPGHRENQRCRPKPAQGNALGGEFKTHQALKGRHALSRPFRAWPVGATETQGGACVRPFGLERTPTFRPPSRAAPPPAPGSPAHPPATSHSSNQ